MYGKVNILTWYAELKHIGATLDYRMQAVRFVLSSVAEYKYFVSKVREIPFLSMNLWSLNLNHDIKVLPEHIGKCTCPAAINRALHVILCGRINRRALPGNSRVYTRFISPRALPTTSLYPHFVFPSQYCGKWKSFSWKCSCRIFQVVSHNNVCSSCLLLGWILHNNILKDEVLHNVSAVEVHYNVF